MNNALLVLLIVYFIVSTYIHIHGTIIAFKKRWYLGLMAIFVPFFATAVYVAKVFFKKDLLK